MANPRSPYLVEEFDEIPLCPDHAVLLSGDDDRVFTKEYQSGIHPKRTCPCIGCKWSASLHDDGLWRLSTKEDLGAREEAHFHFDRLYKSGLVTRTKLYRWLGRALKLEPRDRHFKRLNTKGCYTAIELSRKKWDKLAQKRKSKEIRARKRRSRSEMKHENQDALDY